MHFSSPSGCRLSWWRPWKRGATVCRCSGYCSVTVFLNIDRNVTPNPATGSRNLGTWPLPFSCGHRLLHTLARHRWYRVTTGEGVERGIGLLCRLVALGLDRKSTRLNSSHVAISY